MKKIFTIAILFIIFACNQPAKFSIIQKPETKKLVDPIQLEREGAILKLNEIFENTKMIRTVEVSHKMRTDLSKDKNEIFIKMTDETPRLSELKIQCEKGWYSLLLKKSDAINVELRYKQDKKLQMVQLIGDMNNWYPKGADFWEKNGTWRYSFYISPGKYEYMLFLDGKEEILDSRNPNIENGHSILLIDDNRDIAPVLIVEERNNECIKIKVKNMMDEIFVFIENQRLPADYIQTIDTNVDIHLPGKIKNYENKTLRIWAYNAYGLSGEIKFLLNPRECLDKF